MERAFPMEKSPDAFRTISEVADDLDLPQHVLRFWETRFPQIKPVKLAIARSRAPISSRHRAESSHGTPKLTIIAKAEPLWSAGNSKPKSRRPSAHLARRRIGRFHAPSPMTERSRIIEPTQ